MEDMEWDNLNARHRRAVALVGQKVSVNEMVQEPSPYQGSTGAVIGLQMNVEKGGEKHILYA